MGSTQQLVTVDDNSSSGLTDTQVKALDHLSELGAAPRSSPDEKWSKNPQIRAYQMVFEGKLGGSQPGGGRKKQNRHERAAASVAQRVRTDKIKNKIFDAIDRGLDEEAGHRVNLDAAKFALELEAREDALALKEEEHDQNLAEAPREEILANLFAILEDPHTSGIIEAAFEEITEAEVVTTEADPSALGEDGSDRTSSSTGVNGSDTRDVVADGTQGSSRNRPKGKKPLKKITKRRAAE